MALQKTNFALQNTLYPYIVLRILVDTALLLNDFFHRRPEVAALRGGPEPTEALQQSWQYSHEALLVLSLQPTAHVCLAEYSALRLASVLSDLRLPAGEVLEELRYWNSNFRLLALSPGEAEHALESGLEANPTSTRPAEDYMLAHLARRYEADYVLSPLPRSEGALGTTAFRLPSDVLRELTETDTSNKDRNSQ